MAGIRPVTTQIDDEGRVCTVCGQYKVWNEYSNSSYARNGKNNRCRGCDSVVAKNSYNRIGRAVYAASRRYGIPAEVLKGWVGKQFDCDICGVELPEWPNKSVHLDHDHSSGKFRGILCRDCNNGLGMFREDTSIFRKAVRYLEDADGQIRYTGRIEVGVGDSVPDSDE